MYYEEGTITPVVRDKHGNRKHLTKAADDLGVSLRHLTKVLDRGRPSASLWERIKEIHPELLNPELWNTNKKEAAHA